MELVRLIRMCLNNIYIILIKLGVPMKVVRSIRMGLNYI
jgi:hypothetical protein